ncbi:hypothetical protein ACSNOI_23080 [Actinomadura kijaniata]|uniref:hypothetical protein n=1 Tax=Actinomadura kijaniata TaxID=46161 RepID=UPI003F1D25D4
MSRAAVDAGPGPALALAADPELRITAHVHERAHGSPPAALRRVRGGLVLLGGAGSALTVALPWGTVVTAGPDPDGAVALYSMNRYTDAFTADRGRLRAALAAGAVPPWTAPAVTALLAHADPAPGARLVVNRLLPAETGLLTGAETACAVTLALGDLYGPPARDPAPDPAYAASLHAREGHAMLVTGGAAVRHLPCDLRAAGLRLLVAVVGAGAAPSAAGPDADADLVGRAETALRTGGPAGLGPLLTEAHRPGTAPLDAALDAAREAGALGGRAVGRCVVALVPLEAVPHVRARVTATLTGRTQHPPRFLTATPAGV